MLPSVSFSARLSRTSSASSNSSHSSNESSSILYSRGLTLVLGSLCVALRLLFHSPRHFHKDVTVQLFQWPWTAVGYECEHHLGPAGYRWVQISPPQEHVASNSWWADYQAVSYKLESKHGTAEEFEHMVRRCNAAGVGVIVDAVINHMTAGLVGGLGTGGSSHSHYKYPNLYDPEDFHHCGRNGNDHIANYEDRWEVQNCELVGLADLRTEKDSIRNVLGSYLDRLARIGVSGFRIDAAKHMPIEDIQAILKRVTNGGSMRVVQEVFFGATDAVRPEEYMATGNVHMFKGASDLERMFKSEGIAYLVQPVPWGLGWGDGYLPSSHSQVFITNHDLERGGGGIDPSSPHYPLAHAFAITWDYGQVDVFSGYNFTHFDDGPPAGAVECGRSGWRCDHRHPYILGAIQIRRMAGSEPVRNAITSGENRIGYSRGSKAFVAINNTPTDWILPLGTIIGMKGGEYQNVMGLSTLILKVGKGGRLEEPVAVPAYGIVGIIR